MMLRNTIHHRKSRSRVLVYPRLGLGILAQSLWLGGVSLHEFDELVDVPGICEFERIKEAARRRLKSTP